MNSAMGQEPSQATTLTVDQPCPEGVELGDALA